MQTAALITGITGMVGSHLADHLLEYTDWTLYGMCRWRSSLANVEHLLDRANRKDRLHFVYGDLCDTISLQNVVAESRPDYVFHLAAKLSHDELYFTHPDARRQHSRHGPAAGGDSPSPGPDPVIHVCASSEVFGRVPRDKLPIGEECSFHPASPYAISKTGTDLVGRFYAEAYGMKAMTMRMFTHTGPRRGDVFAESSFAKQIAMIEAGVAAEPVVRTGNLQSLRTWSDVRDAVRAYHLLVTVHPIPGLLQHRRQFLVHRGRDAAKTDFTIVPREGDPRRDRARRLRPLDADLQVPDTTKFRKHTGWEPASPSSRR